MGKVFKINISIDVKGLHKFHPGGQLIDLVESIQSSPQTADELQVVWLAMTPFEATEIEWDDDYYLYASETAVASGTQIIVTSQTDSPAVPGTTYDFKNGVFSPVTHDSSQTAYSVQNNSGSPLTFGLARAMLVAGKVTPLNATTVSNAQTAAFQSNETWFLYPSRSNSGKLIHLPSDAVKIEFPNEQTAVNVGYDDKEKRFFVIR